MDKMSQPLWKGSQVSTQLPTWCRIIFPELGWRKRCRIPLSMSPLWSRFSSWMQAWQWKCNVPWIHPNVTWRRWCSTRVWVENLKMSYEDTVISKFLRYTTKTMRQWSRRLPEILRRSTGVPEYVHSDLECGASSRHFRKNVTGGLDDLRGQIDDQRRPCECRKPVKCRVQDGLTVGVQVPRRYREIFGAACTRGIQVGERVHTTVWEIVSGQKMSRSVCGSQHANH